MKVQEMIQEALNHKHEPIGGIRWEHTNDSSRQFAPCKCGVTLTRQTAPQDARYNWEDWKVMS
jgi:hypothetical protein